MKLEVSDGARVSLFANYVYGKSPGTCEVRYYYSTSAEGPYELKAIAHVTVLPSEPLTIGKPPATASISTAEPFPLARLSTTPPLPGDNIILRWRAATKPW